MNWNKGFTARYYATLIDKRTWRDTTRFEITGGSVKITDTNLRESADIQCKEFDQNEEHWVRVFLDARQEGDGMVVPLFTGIASLPDTSFNGRKESARLQCYSVLKPADDILLPLGWYIQKGANGARAVRELLQEITPAPIEVIDEENSPRLSKTLVAESGETHLSMVDYILSTIGWVLTINGYGMITVKAPVTSYSTEFSDLGNDVIELNVTIENNWYDCPNVFRATNGNVMAIAKDEDPESRFSIQSRGREIWMEDTSASLNEGETIGQYAKRRLQEEQVITYKLTYDRRFDPSLRVEDRIWINYPQQGIDGLFQITNQSIELSYGARVSEEVVGV